MGLRSAPARIAAYLLIAASILFIGALGVLAMSGLSAGVQGPGAAAYGAGIVATAVVAAILILPPASGLLARLVSIEPGNPVHALAVVLAAILVGTEIASQLTSDVVTATGSVTPLRPADLVIQEIPFLLAALLGVGLFIRRGLHPALDRLGLVVPRLWQLLLGIAAAGVIYALGNAIDGLGHRFTPDQAVHVERVTRHLFGGFTGPWGVLAIALAPGICEEALFRGALQPRFGIVLSSIVFAAVHTQYGLSFDLLAVLILAAILGVVRRLANTTASIIAHSLYNGLVAVGIGGAMIAVAVGLEASLLVALAVYAAWSIARTRAASS